MMRFKYKSLISRFIILMIILVSLLVGLTGCGQARQNTAASSQGSGNSDPLNEKGFLTYIHMADARTGWTCTKESILRTVDGGGNWTDVTPKGQASLLVSSLFCLDGQDAVLAFTQESSPQIIVCRTTDGGQNWEKSAIDTGPNLSSVAKLSFADAEHGWLLASYGAAMGSEFDELFQTTDGGTTWKSIAVASSTPKSVKDLPLEGIKTSLAFADRNKGWLTGFSHGDGIWLFYSADGMRSFTSVKPNIDLTNLSQLDFASEQIGWGIIDGYLWKTTDGGHVWTQMVNQSTSQTAIESSMNLNATVLKKRGIWLSPGKVYSTYFTVTPVN